MEEALLRAVLFGTPILLAGLGALLAERSGVVNLGVEGMMALAALTAFAAAQAYGPLPGVLAAFGVGALSGLFLGLFAVTLRANQFVAGLAVAALGLGASGLLGKRYEGLPLAHPLPEGGFALLGAALALLVHLFLTRTRTGLFLRSAGENPKAVDLFGVSVDGVRYLARRDDRRARLGGHRLGDPRRLASLAGPPWGLFLRPPLLPAVPPPGQCTYTERGLCRRALPSGYPGPGALGPVPGPQGPGPAL